MDSEAERMRILEMIEAGSITAEQGLLLLQALNGAADEDEAEDEELMGEELEPGETAATGAVPGAGTGWETLDLSSPAPPAPFSPPLAPAVDEARGDPELLDPHGYSALDDSVEILDAPRSYDDSGLSSGLPAEAARWRRFWVIPLWIGTGVTMLGALMMYLSLGPAGAITGWFLFASIPFALGVVVLALALASRSVPWLHLRVQQAPGETPQRIALSFPLPVGLAAWFLRTFGRFIPNLPDANLDQMIVAVGRSATPENPIYIQVDEGDDGEKVEIYIG